MTNFERVAKTPEALGKFLAALPVLEGPWDDEFQRRFCKNCQAKADESCDHNCPDKKKNRAEWWLSLKSEEVKE